MDRIIISTGYMGSGSSAITDLVAEFKDCRNDFKDYEYILLHAPNGIFDLEDKLLKGNNAIRSDEAIRTFRKFAKKLYSERFWWVANYKKIIGPEFMNITDRYINSLVDFKYNSYWYMHEEPDLKMILKLIIRKPFKLLTLNKVHFKQILRYNDGMKISIPKSDEFYNKTRKYIYELIDYISKGCKNIILDQFVLPFNLHRIDNYFDDLVKVIVVERDPRDVFLSNKYNWVKINYGVPMPLDAKEFCDYYRKMRESEIPSNSNKILRIRFEDLIYNYENELKKIMKFLNFTSKDHVNKKLRFDPSRSIKNTQLFLDEKYADEVKIIEKNLKEYLYDFPYEVRNDIKKVT